MKSRILTCLDVYRWLRDMYQFGKGFLLIFMAFQVFKETLRIIIAWMLRSGHRAKAAGQYFSNPTKLIWFNAWDTPCSPCRAKRIPESLPEALRDLF